jgi:hypothetical protein
MLESLQLPLTNICTGGALFDDARVYRYRLWREWAPGAVRILWIMLNPSTADEVELDPTIRRCVGFTKRWGYGGIEICNIFALRSTDPLDLYGGWIDPIGRGNDETILSACKEASLIMAAWGVHGEFFNRGKAVEELLVNHGYEMKCLGTTKAGFPRHPLYVRGDTKPIPHRAAWMPYPKP